MKIIYEICNSHSGDAQDSSLLVCNTVLVDGLVGGPQPFE